LPESTGPRGIRKGTLLSNTKGLTGVIAESVPNRTLSGIEEGERGFRSGRNPCLSSPRISAVQKRFADMPNVISRKSFPKSALRGDFFGIIHEGGQRVAKTLGEFIGALSDEIAKEVGFEA